MNLFYVVIIIVVFGGYFFQFVVICIHGTFQTLGGKTFDYIRHKCQYGFKTVNFVFFKMTQYKIDLVSFGEIVSYAYSQPWKIDIAYGVNNIINAVMAASAAFGFEFEIA